MIRSKVTKRGVTYIGYKCNANCEICYYKFKPKTWNKLSDIKSDLIVQSKYYKLEATDITGGEPTVHPNIIEILKFCKSLGIKSTIITNGIAMTKEMDDLITDSWLISVHGIQEHHDKIVGKPTFSIIENNLKSIKKPFRLNCVITKGNYTGFVKYADWITHLDKLPTEVNFINFNPFAEWSKRKIDFLPPLNNVGDYLLQAIRRLETAGITVTVRYLPYCYAKGFEKNVVGFSQVYFDDKEWNPALQNHAEVRYAVDNQYAVGCGRGTVVGNSAGLKECRECKFEFICDGINKSYINNDTDLVVTPFEGEKIFDPLYFFNKKEVKRE